MASPFMGEIRMMSFNFAPQGWAMCNGQFLPINQNQALFSLLGTTYGGNGQTTFQLPDLRGRAPMHFGNGHTLGEKAGEEAHTVTISELPTHVHTLNATTAAATTPSPDVNTILASSNPQLGYAGPGNLAAMSAASIANTGGSQAHLNMQPYLVITFCIALQGLFPSQN
jgi:microcystin-dependent protein